jgi:hypothetical protein
MEISHFLVQVRAGADHCEPLIAEDADEIGWIIAGRSETRRQQQSRGHYKGYRDDPGKLHYGKSRGVFLDAVRLHAVCQARPMIERRDGVTRSRESPHGGNDRIVAHTVAHHDDKSKYAYFKLTDRALLVGVKWQC